VTAVLRICISALKITCLGTSNNMPSLHHR
jgi:hypothetical protein